MGQAARPGRRAALRRRLRLSHGRIQFTTVLRDLNSGPAWPAGTVTAAAEAAPAAPSSGRLAVTGPVSDSKSLTDTVTTVDREVTVMAPSQ